MSFKHSQLELKAYSTKELAGIYKVSARTFNKWIKRFKPEIGERAGKFYTINQVKIIFDKIGLPGTVS